MADENSDLFKLFARAFKKETELPTEVDEANMTEQERKHLVKIRA
jgi:hypothetical protein